MKPTNIAWVIVWCILGAISISLFLTIRLDILEKQKGIEWRWENNGWVNDAIISRLHDYRKQP